MVSLVLGNAQATERAKAMEARLKELAPELATESFRVGFADDGALGSGKADAYRHMMLVSVRLADGSWVNFSSSALGASQHIDWSVVAITIGFGVGIVVVALLLLRWATRPLRDLAIAAERFSLDQAPQPLPENGPIEVRRAARAFNTMRERIQRLVSERMQAMAAVSHDLRTPITRLRLRSEFLDDEPTRVLIDADLGEMEAMIDSTLEYLRGGVSSEAIRRIDLASVIESIVDEHCDQGHCVALTGLTSAQVMGRVVSLKRAFSNIIGNAIKYGETVSVMIAEANDQLVITVEDEGPGTMRGQSETLWSIDQERNAVTAGLEEALAAMAKDGAFAEKQIGVIRNESGEKEAFAKALLFDAAAYQGLAERIGKFRKPVALAMKAEDKVKAAETYLPQLLKQLAESKAIASPKALEQIKPFEAEVAKVKDILAGEAIGIAKNWSF